jgi:hypothetical protein
MTNRRDFLRQALSAMVAGTTLAFPPVIRRALAIPGNHRTRTIRDVEHVVILMQENRSFRIRIAGGSSTSCPIRRRWPRRARAARDDHAGDPGAAHAAGPGGERSAVARAAVRAARDRGGAAALDAGAAHRACVRQQRNGRRGVPRL